MLFGKLGHLVAGSKPGSPSVDGFTYVPAEDKGPLAHAETGKTIRIPDRGSPWIVVNHDLSSVIVAKWPGRLWEATIIEAATHDDQARTGGPPRLPAKYTRAIAISVGAELPAWILFGSSGEQILPVIRAAASLTREQASAFAAARSPQAAEATDRVWKRWLQSVGASDRYREGGFDRALAIGGVSDRSPVRSALLVVYDQIFQRATSLEDSRVTIEDGEDVWLAEPWSTAAGVLVDATIAQGAPDFVEDVDAEILMTGWRSANID